ncbi:MAG: PAS domain-containing protein [Acidobacteria bacterium]|nr:PAS domain-containing protein [Acidobacteriota bacterium]MBV9478053.1 PAS domain-containing protein [Acidobacteriota bacterium]
MKSRNAMSGIYRTAVVVVLGVFVIGITAAVPALYVAATVARQNARAAIADACAAEVRLAATTHRDVSPSTIALIGQHHDVSLALVDRPHARGDGALRLYRPVNGALLEVAFYSGSPGSPTGALRSLVVVATAGALASVILFAINAAAILGKGSFGNAEERRDTIEEQPLYQSFESSIRFLKGRADELATVTATLVRNLASGFISVDANGAIVDVNHAARELLDLPAGGTVTGRAIAELLGDTEFAHALQAAVDARAAVQRQEVAEPHAGKVFGLTTVPLLDAHGQYLGLLALFTDLTPTRHLEQRVREMQVLADLGELSAGIAHEFRNSLATITGYLQLTRKLPLAPEAEHRVGQAEAEARTLAAAVQSLLHLARPLDPDMQPVDLRELVREVAEAMPELQPIDLRFHGGDARVAGDAALLRRVIENVLRNAAEAIAAAERDGVIDVTIFGGATSGVVIADNGVGVASEQTAKLFLPFQSTKSGGHGLGLALARKIILFHGGRIVLEPRRGGGAAVTIELPAIGDDIA